MRLAPPAAIGRDGDDDVDVRRVGGRAPVPPYVCLLKTLRRVLEIIAVIVVASTTLFKNATTCDANPLLEVRVPILGGAFVNVPCAAVAAVSKIFQPPMYKLTKTWTAAWGVSLACCSSYLGTHFFVLVCAKHLYFIRYPSCICVS